MTRLTPEEENAIIRCQQDIIPVGALGQGLDFSQQTLFKAVTTDTEFKDRVIQFTIIIPQTLRSLGVYLIDRGGMQDADVATIKLLLEVTEDSKLLTWADVFDTIDFDGNEYFNNEMTKNVQEFYARYITGKFRENAPKTRDVYESFLACNQQLCEIHNHIRDAING